MIVHMDDTWELLMDLVMAERARIPQIAAEFRLSPPQVHALRLLEPGRPLPMGRLACALGCDASNVTGIVDRLEQRGLIERRPSARDRRVKVLVVTAQGAKVRKALMIRLGEPPESIASLSPADRRRLAGLLRRALSQAAAAPAP
jgi:MarR family transcriptional regulator, organic hydroperoxide resistance regulator